MRKLLIGMLAVTGLGAIVAAARVPEGLVGSPVQAVQKIAYLHSDKLISEAPGAAEVRTQLQQEAARYDARMKILNDSAEALQAEFQRQSVLLSPEEKKKREDALRARGTAMQQRATILQQEMDNRQQELMGPILKKVEDAIEAVRKEGGYSIIFDATARMIVSADTTLDLTTTVAARLKAAAPAGAVKK